MAGKMRKWRGKLENGGKMRTWRGKLKKKWRENENFW
jgi:hypothetical protein